MAAVLSRVFSSSPSKLSSVPAEIDTLSSSHPENHRASELTSDPTEFDIANKRQDLKTETEDEDFVNQDEDEQGELDEEQDEEVTLNGTIDGKEVLSTPLAPRRDSNSRQKRAMARAEAAGDDLEDDISEDSSDSRSTSSEVPSYVDDTWEGRTDESGDFQPEIANRNQCIFCGEDEEHDPGEDFEEFLACSACGDNAHSHCARESNSLMTDEDATKWRCPQCVEQGVEPDAPDFSLNQEMSSAPKLARDLLPAQKGLPKPGSHSVFNKLILDDDPLDGSRSLRKRKASDVSERSQTESKKRQRRSQSVIVLDPVQQPNFRNRDLNLAFPNPQDNSSRSRSTRNKQGKVAKALVSVIEASSLRLVLALRCEPTKLANLEHERRKRRRRERDRARRAQQTEREVVEVSHYPALQQSSFAAPAFALQDREGEEIKSKPYGGILSEPEADTTKTFPQALDRKKFEDARQKAEEEWRRKIAAANTAELTRPSQKVSGPPSKIKCINFGQYEIDTWHAAPYPEEYSRNRVLYICEFCLKYMNSDFVAWRHKLKCPARHPPGDEIYRDGSFSFFEVDGRKNPVYCQNLCLLAKLFLGSKTLYYDVEPFLFYVMTENDDYGCHFVGYFSKEKRPSSQNNVSCILVLPIHQRRGFGHFLIDFSYLLTRVEKKTGSPEKPLSDMGLVSYRSYWRLILCYELLEQKDQLSISDIANRTGMTADDIVCGLEGLRALVRDPISKRYALRLDYPYFKQYIENYERKGYAKINPEALIWVPYVMGKQNSHYEHGPQLHTVAQRDDNLDNAFPEEGVQMTANGISTRDYATYGEDLHVSASDTLTPQDEKHSSDEDYSTGLIAGKKPNAIQEGGLPDGLHEDEEEQKDQIFIPPTRFEVFPPLPGTVPRKRGGRSFGRTASQRATPMRRGLSFNDALDTSRLNTARRQRSRLVEALEGADGDGEPSTPEVGGQETVEQRGDNNEVADDEEKAADLQNQDSTIQPAD